MTARPEPSATAHRQAARPADKLFQKSLTAWFAEWKTQKAVASTRLVVSAPTPGSRRTD